MTFLHKKKSGVSLLEITLSLSVIAVLLFGAARYYSNATGSRKINDATQMIKNINAALNEWQGMMKSNQNPPTLSTVALTKVGLLPAEFAAAGANPWGGAIQVTALRGGQFRITFADVPQADCLILVEVAKRDSITGSCVGGDFIINRPVIFSGT